ncbi:MAG TPA: HNH endonuclease signature motif containing protein, partial [Mycobacterium sp.]
MFDTGSDPAVLLLQRVCSAARAEACAAAARLVAIGDLVALRLTEDGGAADDWTIDAVDAVGVEVSAALGISRGMAASQLRYAHALRIQLPQLGRVFSAGDIDETTFCAAVFRTGLITDHDVLADVDAQLAVKAPRWGVMNRSQLATCIDRIVARVDRDAVRRRKDRLADREVYVGDVGNGLAEIVATVYAPDGHAVADRLTALAHTVCEGDPRSIAQRRADGFAALAAGADRLGCRCARPDCPAGGNTASAVVIHVIAEQATVEGTGDTPAAMIGYDGLIPAELIAELAHTARLRPLLHPGDAPAEAGYRPSKALADFVRHRDLTCRFPNCAVPASDCDIDHVIPHAEGGPTHASNLSCKCRTHHLAKTFWGW